ncbi:MAG: TRAP transporter large permease [Dehalococcoidales bacterium]|nr:TRAP transporter large permease [Dehalococcoidales bacterium]
MDPVVVGLVGIIILIVLFILGMPVGFAMAFVGFAGFSYLVSPSAGLNLLARDVFTNLSSYSLTVIPMFLLMGSIAFASGISTRLYAASHTLLGNVRGGLAMATIMACAGFAAICGSTSATAAAMGKVALPEMKKYGYADSLATGSVASAGSLGILIPPSTIFIVYGILTRQSIGSLFLAGILPGILLATLFVIVVAVMCRRNPALAPAGQSTTFKEKLVGISGVTEMLLLFFLVMGGLFAGWFSPVQAGAVGAAGALLIGIVRRNLSWQAFKEAIIETVKVTCEIMIIVTGAIILSHFIAVTTIPNMLSGWISGLGIPDVAVIAMIILMYLIGGLFMDSLAMITLTIPIIYPLVLAMGFDPIWFGVIIVLVTEMGVITPPVGINVYVIKGITKGISLETIFKGIIPFLIAIIICVALLLAFTKIATFLPGIASY